MAAGEEYGPGLAAGGGNGPPVILAARLPSGEARNAARFTVCSPAGPGKENRGDEQLPEAGIAPARPARTTTR